MALRIARGLFRLWLVLSVRWIGTRAAILAAQKPSEVDLEALQRSESEGLLAQLGPNQGRSSLMTERKPGPHYIIERIVKWERERYGRVIDAETQRVVIEAPWDELCDRMDELAAGQRNVTVQFKPLEPEGW